MHNTKPTPVLVTGAGSGIGLAIVQALLQAGHRVYAGARQAGHRRMLQDLGAQALPLDVRDAAQAQQAADSIVQAGHGLHAVVHNAGVGGIGLLLGWPDEDLHALFDTNVFGPHRLTRALMPLLLQSRGRVVCIGSQGGSIASPLMGPYTMSKHALEAYAECLRLELAPHGLAVSMVQPGAVATAIGDKGRAGNVARLQATPPPFDQASKAVMAELLNPTPPSPDEPESASNRRHAAPEKVAAVVMQALFDAQPQARYLVGTRWEGDRVIAALITRLLDAAQSPSHGLSLQQLVERLASAWQARDHRP